MVCTPLGPPSSTTIVRVAPRDKHRPGGDRAIGSACRQRCGRYRLWWRSPGSRGRGWRRSLGGRRDFRQRLASAVAHDEGSGAEYLVGRAQKLPLPDASIGIALFMRTLHHVPSSELAHALREARRVLRSDGAVFVAEPLPQGDYFARTSLVENELSARQAVQEALAKAPAAGLVRATTVEYMVELSISDFASLRRRIVSVDPSGARSSTRGRRSWPRRLNGLEATGTDRANAYSLNRCAWTCSARRMRRRRWAGAQRLYPLG